MTVSTGIAITIALLGVAVAILVQLWLSQMIETIVSGDRVPMRVRVALHLGSLVAAVIVGITLTAKLLGV
jgi:hypothetical protein